jgi:hypothetical protein
MADRATGKHGLVHLERKRKRLDLLGLTGGGRGGRCRANAEQIGKLVDRCPLRRSGEENASFVVPSAKVAVTW